MDDLTKVPIMTLTDGTNSSLGHYPMRVVATLTFGLDGSTQTHISYASEEAIRAAQERKRPEPPTPWYRRLWAFLNTDVKVLWRRYVRGER